MINAKSTPSAESPRLRREARTIELMIRMYCGAGHPCCDGASAPGHDSPLCHEASAPTTGPDCDSPAGRRPRRSASHSPLCPDCAALLAYSLERVAARRFGAAKPVCSRCTVHCYRPALRERVRAAMRYSGPRMTYRHPCLAVRHLLARRREPPVASGRNRKRRQKAAEK